MPRIIPEESNPPKWADWLEKVSEVTLHTERGDYYRVVASPGEISLYRAQNPLDKGYLISDEGRSWRAVPVWGGWCLRIFYENGNPLFQTRRITGWSMPPA